VAQDGGTTKTQDITVRVLDGRNGNPMTHQHILIFSGLSTETVKQHGTDITTDKDGVGTLTINPIENKLLQVFVDGHALCYPNPNQSSFKVDEIIANGLATPNNCSNLVRETSPGHFIVFARPAHFWEKMKW